MILESAVGKTIKINHTNYLYFAGNNYLGLANHPSLQKAAHKAIDQYGINFAASRQTTGSSIIHILLERQLARFHHKEQALFFASGYMSNQLIMEALKDQFNVVIADNMLHPSLRQGIPPSISKIIFYRHQNMNELESALESLKPQQRALILTDGVFALSGEIAPLKEIHYLALNHNALILVDDAHTVGVLGPSGKGTSEYYGLDDSPIIFRSGTMSKAFGAYGGYITGTKKFIDKIRKQSLFYSGSTALPPSLTAAASAAVNYVSAHPELRTDLLCNAQAIREGIIQLGLDTSNSIMPIIPVFFEKQETADQLSAYLENHKIIAPSVSYPVDLQKSLVRITVSAIHSREEIHQLLNTISHWKNQL